MQTKISEGDRVTLRGEVTHVHDDGTITVWLPAHATPITIRADAVDSIEKRRPDRPPGDRWH
ncbi:MAG: hypothetical protein ABWY13_05300 [Mesorhizobium sp.]|jgi:hypothetical protein|nr:hypothetical protein [Mesorhizobium sp.]